MRSIARIDPPLRVGLPLIILIAFLFMTDLRDQCHAAYSNTVLYIHSSHGLPYYAIRPNRQKLACMRPIAPFDKVESNCCDHLHGCSSLHNTCGALLCNAKLLHSFQGAPWLQRSLYAFS